MRDIVGSIVVYNNPLTHVRDAIRSFLNTQRDVKLYVLDNSPYDHARQLCDDERIVYILNDRNLGYGAAHNIALRRSVNSAQYHLVLNPDVYFDAGVLEELVDFACHRPDIGLIMPKVLHPDGSIQHLCKKLPTPADLVLRRFLPPMLRPFMERRMAKFDLRDQDYGRMLSVPYLSGCFMMLNCEVLAHIGFFDERYFMYFEDLDLCRRIHQRFKTVYFPHVAIYHHYAKGSYHSPRLMGYHIVNAIRYFQKWGWFSDRERNEINSTEPCPID